MALIILLENLNKALDIRECSIGIFVDFLKAFGTINHGILLDKLYHYGMRDTAYHWFSINLNEIYESVVYNGCQSEYTYIQCGVPQRSILEPLLFLIYINDSPYVSNLFMSILFADDTNLFVLVEYSIVNVKNDEMSKVSSWVEANKLSLNIDKTNVMLFTPKGFF